MNRNNLNGTDRVIGGTWDIPKDNKIAETIRSIDINGMYMRKPISNARFSSEMTKEGTRIEKSLELTSAREPSGQSRSVAERKNARSSGVVNLIK